MEIYILDSLLRREQVVDKFESMIWSERFNEIGDFEMVIRSTRESRGQFYVGTKLALNLSWRVMIVETVEDTFDAEGKQVLNVKGRSMESIFHDRVARQSLTYDPENTAWELYGRPGDIARRIFDVTCRTGVIDPGDKIPFMVPGVLHSPGTIPETDVPVTMKFELQTVYDAIKLICDTYDLGFRIERNFDASQLYFEIYAGSDRTTRQKVLPPVIFAMNYENLQNSTELTNIADSKNVAYVFSDRGSMIVYPDVVAPDTDGLERRVLLVEASDIDEDTVDVNGALKQAGWEALAQARGFAGFDGEINQDSGYLYGRDYELGDIVEMRNSDGIITYKRVTEQIFVHDAEGERSYPTLAMNMFISQNTWLSQTTEKVWEDFTDEHWADM